MGFDKAKGDTVANAYARTSGPVAFLDESYQAPDPVVTHDKTFYVFTAVVVQQEEMEELRAGLEEIAEDTWWHTTKAMLEDEGRRKTQDMLEFLAEGHEACVVAHQIPVGLADHSAEAARRACYRGLAIELAAGADEKWDPVELMVLEERNQMNLRSKDHKNHKELVTANAVPRNMRLLQTSPKFERLLWLPDVVSMAYRRTLTHVDETSKLFGIIEEKVHFVQPME